MRKLTAFLLALILGLGFTLISGVDNANAKTAFLGNISISMAPNDIFVEGLFLFCFLNN